MHRMCTDYYHPYTQYADKSGKIGLLLGVILVLNLIPNYAPKENTKYSIISNFERKNTLSNPYINKLFHKPLQLISEREIWFFNRKNY